VSLKRRLAKAVEGFPPRLLLPGLQTSCGCGEPVNYVRANWIRPEDLGLYEKLGFHNFKIVERNTPTPILLERVRAYAARRYDGNLLDLVQNYAYPESAFAGRAKDAYSWRRLAKYFLKPQTVNLLKFTKVIGFGKTASVLYPRRGPNPCTSTTAPSTASWSASPTKVAWPSTAKLVATATAGPTKPCASTRPGRQDGGDLRRLAREIDGGTFWEPYVETVRQLLRRTGLVTHRRAATPPATRPQRGPAPQPRGRAPKKSRRSRLPIVEADA